MQIKNLSSYDLAMALETRLYSIDGVNPVVKPKTGTKQVQVSYRFVYGEVDSRGHSNSYQVFRFTFYPSGSVILTTVVSENSKEFPNLTFPDTEKMLKYITYRHNMKKFEVTRMTSVSI